MSLLEKIRTINIYIKNIKKSIHFSQRIDIFLVIAILILIASPFIINYCIRMNIERKKINLLLSPYCAELFGKEMTEKLILDFNETNPNIRIQLFSSPNEKSMNEKNIEPDIYFFDGNEYKNLMSAKALAKLNSYGRLETKTNQYAIPIVSFMDMLFYNIDLLSAAGFDRPPKTREEFLLYAKTVSNSSNVRRAYVSGTAISLSPNDKQALSRDIFSWIWAGGSDFFLGINEPVLNTRTAPEDFAFFRSLYSEDALAPNVFETTGEQRLEEFSRGRVSMIIDSTRVIPFLRERMGNDAFGITAIPSSSNSGKYNISLSGIYAGINAKCAYPREAWDFIEYLSGQNQFFNETLKPVFGITSDMLPDKNITDDTFYSKARDIFESSNIVKSFSGNPDAKEYENIFMEELKIFFTGSQSAQQTITAIQQKWNAIDGK